jgi:cyclomaltodextrinase / maltogenic alpha-amylase / neopullulanase
MRRWLHGWLIAGLLCAPLLAQAQAPAPAACRTDPLAGRTIYLRGTFNSWNAQETQKFTWACDRWELVTTLNGEHSFKFGDEGWSADADWGAGAPASNALLAKGPELKRRFNGTHRFTLRPRGVLTEWQLESCTAQTPFGNAVLFMRGSLNNWAVLDDYAFQYSCDAYYLNVKATGRHEFKIADAAWDDTATLVKSGGVHSFNFNGEHTVRLSFAGDKSQLSVGPKTFADPSAKAVTDPVALSLKFNSRLLEHKSPFGALTPGSTVVMSLNAQPGVSSVQLVTEMRLLEGNQERLEYTELARVPMSKTPQADGERWQASWVLPQVGVYGYWFEVEIGGRKFALQNNSDSLHWTREKGVGGAAAVADLPAQTRSVRRFRQTVYAADFVVPAWASDAVYYYIFPDRFRNGDKRNDPKPGRDKYQKHSVEFHRDWNSKPYRPGSGDGSDAVFNNDFFGGDLAGVIQKLDYIKSLGANTIYMTPIFKAASNHKYDTADYLQIDPAFGSNADFERLTQEAKKRGLRVLIDTSLNHTGSDSIYFNRFGNHGKSGAFQNGKINSQSPYASWYSFDVSPSDPDKQFKGWVGIADLPELDKNAASLRQFAYANSQTGVTQTWLRRGASGWRMDVAPWVPDDFWRQWRRAVKAQDPNAITVAETWFDASKHLLGDMFDSTMNYVFRNAVLDYVAGGKAQDLVNQLEHLREAYPPPAFYALMNLVSSHDQARALHVLGWNAHASDAATIALAKQRLRLATFIQLTSPGAPAIYYGDEVGVTGGDDPLNRATYPWADRGGKPDQALLAEFQKLTQLRRDHAVLRQGSSQAPLLVDAHAVVFVRRLGDQWALVAINNSAQARTVQVALPREAAGITMWTDVLPGTSVTSQTSNQTSNQTNNQTNSLSIELPALGGRVLLGRR